MTAKPPLWILSEGLTLVRDLQAQVRPFGYHVAIGGGVVNNTRSFKDLDLYFLPLCNGKLTYPRHLLAHLTKLWGEAYEIGEYYQEDRFYQKRVSFPNRGKRIDAFIG